MCLQATSNRSARIILKINQGKVKTREFYSSAFPILCEEIYSVHLTLFPKCLMHKLIMACALWHRAFRYKSSFLWAFPFNHSRKRYHFKIHNSKHHYHCQPTKAKAHLRHARSFIVKELFAFPNIEN